MKYLEETIIIISVCWMIIYLYGLDQLNSVAYNHWLIFIPILLVLWGDYLFFGIKRNS
jgi:hypothetical protein